LVEKLANNNVTAIAATDASASDDDTAHNFSAEYQRACSRACAVNYDDACEYEVSLQTVNWVGNDTTDDSNGAVTGCRLLSGENRLEFEAKLALAQVRDTMLYL